MKVKGFFAMFLALMMLTAAGCSDDDDSPTGVAPKRYDIAYIYGSHTVNSNSFEIFLEDHDYYVDQIDIEDVPLTGLDDYELIIVGHSCPAPSPDAATNIKNSYKPVLAMGSGGALMFQEMGLSINWGHSWIDADTASTSSSSISIHVVDPTHTVFVEPNDIQIMPTGVVQLYDHSGHVAEYAPNLATGVVLLGREPDNATHYSLCTEYGKFFLWGFFNGPHAMTNSGRELYLNVVRYLTRFEG